MSSSSVNKSGVAIAELDLLKQQMKESCDNVVEKTVRAAAAGLKSVATELPRVSPVVVASVQTASDESIQPVFIRPCVKPLKDKAIDSSITSTTNYLAGKLPDQIDKGADSSIKTTKSGTDKSIDVATNNLSGCMEKSEKPKDGKNEEESSCC